MPNLSAFISYAFITSFTPGPNNIMSMTNATKYGFKKSLPFNFGVFIGFFLIMLVCSFFSITLYSLIPSIKPYMTIIGAAYILWLAWKIFNSKPHSIDEEGKTVMGMWSAVILQFVNVKAILYSFTILSTFIVPYYQSWYSLLIFSVLLAFVGFASTCCWSLFGSVFQKLFIKNEKTVNVIMALLLVYCAVSLFM
ncbi:LysE family transporter [Sedimentibacter hydroxybenzoicus DSM 7310]|uniref:LysE family transporter n=1 Tax=Sedimentibacter hydroxybenzoicus DSM 7310 TaxID=1123245 RepID=A0A974BL43_SEDHY|nr:LysE family transporter [Sedimentibacter hydroxybenzoicus]NYB74851.1 LysE family transporter [Sedimentibacter hydroxybenzoicus DSM 7310]